MSIPDPFATACHLACSKRRRKVTWLTCPNESQSSGYTRSSIDGTGLTGPPGLKRKQHKGGARVCLPWPISFDNTVATVALRCRHDGGLLKMLTRTVTIVYDSFHIVGKPCRQDGADKKTYSGTAAKQHQSPDSFPIAPFHAMFTLWQS